MTATTGNTLTFPEALTAYANYFGSKGEGWLQEYILGRLGSGMTTIEAVREEMSALTETMLISKATGEFADFGYDWSRRDRLWYFLLDWDRYLETGEKYF